MAGDESRAERLDRELIELLNELRVLLPGVQVLFAFLLAVPFAEGFQRITELQRDVYTVCLAAAFGSIVCLVAPTTYHRIQWRQRDKETMLRVSNVLALVGAALLAVSMTASALLIGDYLFSLSAGIVAAAAAGLAFAGLWFVLPLSRRAT